MAQKLIKVHDLKKYYNGGDVKALDGVSVDVNKGDVMAVIGPSGGGKSTFLRSLNLLETPTSGSIIFDGEDITGMNITERAKKGISFAFQQPIRFKGITVRDLIGLAAGKEISDCQACSYLKQVGLCAKDYIDREVNASLSGGEIKRIEIATVMARKTKLSIFDEPEAGIDLWSFNNLIEVFRDMRREINGSIIIISHQERILDIADEIIVLADGKISARGTKEQILPQLLDENCQYCPKGRGPLFEQGGNCDE